MKELAGDLSQVEQWLRPKNGPPTTLPDLSRGLTQPIEVERLKVSVPFSTINTMIPKIAGPQLKEAGVRDLKIGKGRGQNEVSIRGKAKKFLLEAGFDAVGQLDINTKGQPVFSLGQVKVAGLAVPNFLASLATAVLAGSDLQELGVSQSGDDFVIDPTKMLPPNIDSKLTDLRVGEDGFIMEGGQNSAS